MTNKGTISEHTREALRFARKLERYPRWRHQHRSRKADRHRRIAGAHQALHVLWGDYCGRILMRDGPLARPLPYRRWLHSLERRRGVQPTPTLPETRS